MTAGWALTGLSCSGDTTDLEIGYISGGSFTLGSGGAGFDAGDTTFRIDIGAGENVTCTYTNTKDASLIVRKTTVGGVGAFDFDGTGTNVPSDIDITTIAAGTPVAASTIDFVAAPVNQFGVKLVTENVTAGWALTGLSCSGDTTDLEIGYISGGASPRQRWRWLRCR